MVIVNSTPLIALANANGKITISILRRDVFSYSVLLYANYRL